ncbi:zinc-dependent alcohol dehydrogenase [Subtercola frigoramans]|uniref:Threonine 3-dehydrogenase n=1 Tax=Subtercola frigoramans TaxID=120298 RepID=A0ABS2L1D0_9MICO|nr:alcohol dehydrogenase catalytic domain-containing protein [Subtercola frigoramans]MBM7470829.1 threonine 3-dehydrogenase [Subtercola frigoramans]
MKAIRKETPTPGVTFVKNLPESAHPLPGQIKIAVAAASVCGTDLGIARYTPAAQAFNLKLPVTMGHEGSGTVVEVGEGVTSFKPGDDVALDSHIACFDCYQCSIGNAHICDRMQLLGLHVDGLFAEFCTVSASAAYKLPQGFPLEAAALLEPAGVAMHALQSTGEPMLGKRVVITGAGPVGLFIAELAKLGGAAKVVVVEPNPWRRAFAESRGAVALEPSENASQAILDLSGNRGGFDVAFEASGHPSGFGTAINALRKAGTYVSVGFGNAPVELDMGEYLNRRGITMVGSFGRRLWSTWDLLVALVAEGRLDLDAFITHRVTLEEFDHALELLSGDSCKVLVIPSAV